MRRGAALAALLGLAAAWLLDRGFEPRARLRRWLLPPPPPPAPGGRLLSAAELARYRGAAGEPGLYLALLGRVFDVERGRKHYGPGGAYSGLAGTAGGAGGLGGARRGLGGARRRLAPVSAAACPAGRDASRAFATGDFTPAGLVDDVSALSPGELLAVRSWLDFYGHNYRPVGRCSGPRPPRDGEVGDPAPCGGRFSRRLHLGAAAD